MKNDSHRTRAWTPRLRERVAVTVAGLDGRTDRRMTWYGRVVSFVDGAPGFARVRDENSGQVVECHVDRLRPASPGPLFEGGKW